MSTDKLLTVLRQANQVVADLGINQAMECDRVRLEAELAIMRAKRVEIIPFDVCGAEPTVLKPGEHNRYEDGRACSLQP